MTVNLPLPQKDQLKAVKGFEMGIAEAGIKKANRKDLLVMKLAPGSQVAGVFTLNRFCAAPVQVCREHLALDGSKGEIRALVVNTGNANAGTGEEGMKHALETGECAQLGPQCSLKRAVCFDVAWGKSHNLCQSIMAVCFLRPIVDRIQCSL